MTNRIVLMLVLGLTLFSEGCHNETEPVRIIIPNNFRGEINIVEDKEQGIDTPLVSKGRREYIIPQSGILKVKTFGPLQEWHVETAFFADGRPIHDASSAQEEGIQIGKSEIAILGGAITIGTNYPHPTIVSFVGTKKDYSKHIDGDCCR